MLIADVRDRLAAGKPIRRTIEGGGRLHIDRPLPFLCVYRAPPQPDPGTADLVRTQASYLIAPAGFDPTEMIDAITSALAKQCGACLLLELWAGDDAAMRIHVAEADRAATTVDVLVTALGALDLPGDTPRVTVSTTGPRLVTDEAGILSIGLQVPPIYRSERAVYPFVARVFSLELSHALQRAFFEFARVQTPVPPEHFHVLGRRRTVQAVRDSDRALAEISESFDFLLAVTPVNTDAAWQEFSASGCTRAPALHYRMLEVDPALVKRRLYDLPLERLEDPALAQLLHDKRRELDRQLSLLEDRDTPRFLYGSLQLYGGVEDELLAEALEILAGVPPSASPTAERCNAQTFVGRARAELALYPGLAAQILVREDLTSLLVSHGDMLVPATLDVAAHRVEALLQHELGTHVVTYANGSAQPLRVFAVGLAGYEALQEGLATFAEFVVGGLDTSRLRLIAARVVAVRRVIEDLPFAKVVAELTEQHGIPRRTAFGIAVRVFRGGGLTKDAIYLRGLQQTLSYLKRGGDLRPLLVGKIALEQVPIVEELIRREVLVAPALVPRWLAAAGSEARLARAAAGLRVIDLSSPKEATA
ncbi:flavohemoglobin expression-modulating QEGLA motif protein [soil metagenome]